jgi:hypothetical protein
VPQRVLVDIAKIILPVLVAATLGQWLAVSWQNARQAREQDLATAATFYALYGRFFTVWKKWRETRYATTEDEAVARLLDEATGVEGEMEALLAKVVSERCLSEIELERLGAFRQAFQKLRESIAGDDESVSEWKCSWHTEYVAMKALTSDVTSLVATSRTDRFGLRGRRPAPVDAKRALLNITSNYYEARWVEIGLEAADQGRLLRDWDEQRFGQPCTPAAEGKRR